MVPTTHHSMAAIAHVWPATSHAREETSSAATVAVLSSTWHHSSPTNMRTQTRSAFCAASAPRASSLASCWQFICASTRMRYLPTTILCHRSALERWFRGFRLGKFAEAAFMDRKALLLPGPTFDCSIFASDSRPTKVHYAMLCTNNSLLSWCNWLCTPSECGVVLRCRDCDCHLADLCGGSSLIHVHRSTCAICYLLHAMFSFA